MSAKATKSSSSRRVMARLRHALGTVQPAKLLLLGYCSYIAIGWALLSLPVAQEQAVAALDALFIATSAVSTTGLVTVDPGGNFTFFGELVILLLIQIGGLGYMTVGSFALLTIQNRLSRVREKTTRAAFNLPENVRAGLFVRSVIIFTLTCEAIGALALYALFSAQGVENAAWAAIFHAVSAFCTAGFSLFSTSLEAFRGDTGVVLVISALSLLGAMGFLIIVDFWRNLFGRKQYLGFTSKIILRMTLMFLFFGTLLLFIIEPGFRDLPPSERLLTAFFQTMTATTTVGFNTYPIGALSLSVIMVIFVLMIIGASPAGTGGGLKTTSFAVLVGLVRSSLKGRDEVRFFKRRVPADKLQTATASLTYYMALLAIAMFLLLMTEPAAAFETVMFEVISALGTVGLSMGLTGDLSPLGKIIIIVLMIAGRVGILTFGIALAAHDESREEERDNDVVV
ncbi:TrkH family potassium uptake protein [Cognatishimia sp. MH4019]|uniref:TrkH family potassium uptake protein n=1 Tax=Cognatishimia sp. MH4019 TaxID=2854030 RepID=UPI001CD2A41A|nr:potassium transporter TrkG [Cognatishimia sp. MH4019]